MFPRDAQRCLCMRFYQHYGSSHSYREHTLPSANGRHLLHHINSGAQHYLSMEMHRPKSIVTRLPPHSGPQPQGQQLAPTPPSRGCWQTHIAIMHLHICACVCSTRPHTEPHADARHCSACDFRHFMWRRPSCVSDNIPSSMVQAILCE